MPGAIVFDCDGVLLDSNRIKVECFKEALRAAGCAEADVERFSAFQQASFGTSRYRLFDTFLGWDDLAVRPSADRDGLVSLYAGRLRGLYTGAAATPGMRAVVAELAASFPVFIVSGSDEAELREVLAERGDAPLFREILGSPSTKVENLRKLLLREDLAGIRAEELLFVGDAEADFRAAAELGCGFAYMDRFSTAQPRMRALAAEHGFPVIDDLRDLAAAMRRAFEWRIAS